MLQKSLFAVIFSFTILSSPLTASFTDDTIVHVYPRISTKVTKLNPAPLNTFNAKNFKIYGYATGKFESVHVWGDLHKFGISVQIMSGKSQDNKICFSNKEIILAASSTIYLNNQDFGTLSLDFATDISRLTSITDIKDSLEKMFGLDWENNFNPIKLISPSYGYTNGLYQGCIGALSPIKPGEYALHHLASSGKFKLVDEYYNISEIGVQDGTQLCHYTNGIVFTLTEDFKNVQSNDWIKFTIERRSGSKLNLLN